MDNSQVLDADAQREAPLQQPEPIQQDAPQVLNASGNVLQQSQKLYSPEAPVVGEQDHANDIARQVNRENYDYKAAQDQSLEPTVTTQSTTKGNVTDRVTWKSYYGMEDTYKANDSQDYSWNEIAKHRSQYTYQQEATQVLSDYAKSMNEIKEAASQAMDQYFSAAYGANQTADKMGWQGGQVTSNDAKTAFLKASTAANMYNKFELQKYGVESQLSVARLYAEANMEALALDLYQDAVDVATREADITGYYISPEASEIMKQQKVAQDILNNPSSTDADITRANQVISAGNAYFDKLGFEKDPETGQYIGIKTLAQLELEETIYANRENERLQEQANEIAKDAVAATREGIASQAYWAEQSYHAQLRNIEAIENQTYVMNMNQAIQKYGENGTYQDDKGNWVKVTGATQARDGKMYGYVDGKLMSFEKTGNGTLKNAQEAKTATDVSKYGAFSNGYQPKGIGDYGAVKSTGLTTTVNGQKQNVWYTENNGIVKTWVWDGNTMEYKKYVGGSGRHG